MVDGQKIMCICCQAELEILFGQMTPYVVCPKCGTCNWIWGQGEVDNAESA